MATASGGVHLLGSKLNLSKVRDVAREELKKILGKNDTKKVRHFIACMLDSFANSRDGII